MKKGITLSIAALAVLMVGCGGGSSSTAATAKITGTVPGTLIEAICENGYYQQVTSTQNGTNQHPFELEVPVNTNCRLVMTTNENDPANRIITQIGFSNGSTIVLNQDVDLGHIPLELSYENVNDKDGDHVVDTPLTLTPPNGATVTNANVNDANGNGIVDMYDDDDDDNIPNAYEDDDGDGVANLHDDDDGDGRPDHVDDDDNNPNDSHTDAEGDDDKNENQEADHNNEANDDNNENHDNEMDNNDNNENHDNEMDNENNHTNDVNNDMDNDQENDNDMDNDQENNHTDTDQMP